ncbi:MAG: tRNA-intron lyase [Candidatus Bathyarchaeota archaeon]|jgi:tRNA-intron endonuclease
MDPPKTPLAQVEVLRDSLLIVWSHEESRRLYQVGYYGKPLGIPKPKEGFEAPLILDPIEGVYLLEKGLISVYAGVERDQVGLEKLISIASGNLDDFERKYGVYKDLKEKGLVVTPGIKYGCDFAVYEKGPGIDHAPYIIKVKKSGDWLTAAKIVEAGRLATSVRKTFIIAMVQDGEIRYLSFKWWRP